MNRPWKEWVGKCWDVSWHPPREWWGATALLGWGEVSSLKVSQAHIIRLYLQHKTANLFWYLASAQKLGIAEKSDSGWGTCVKQEGYAEASGDEAPWHPERATLEVTQLSLWSLECLKPSCAAGTAWGMNISQPLDQCPMASRLSKHFLPFT